MEQSKINEATGEFERKLNEAKAHYIHSLPGKISEIQLIWNQLNQNAWRTEELLKMQNLAHNLSGSGGTFGFKVLSERAKNLEQLVQELQSCSIPQQQALIKEKITSVLTAIQEIELSAVKMPTSLVMSSSTRDTIYILDAGRESADALSHQLMTYGFKVQIINAQSDLESVLRVANPLLILIDADFAEQPFDKYNVLKTIRTTWSMACPIIYISQQTDLESRFNAIKSGANAYFTKPLDVSLLIERIRILTNAGIIEPYRVLLIEDDKDIANYYALVLEKNGIKVLVETQPEMTLNRIMQFNPELIVMDLYMPNYNGIDLIKVIRQHQSLFTLPIILLTGEKDVNLQFLAREVGVDDFLQKPINEDHLFETVLNRVQRSRYMTVSMTKDSLTGLFVHKKINELLEMHLKVCTRYKLNLAYAILDLDNFKTINDTHGHLVGDDVLVAFAKFLKTSVRVTDFVGRYGGEEFVIIAPETSGDGLLSALDRIRSEFAKVPHYAAGKRFYVTFSAGIASYPNCQSVDEIMTVADKALYDSKEHGRNQITLG